MCRLPVSGPVRAKLTYAKQVPRQSGPGTVLVTQEVELDCDPAEGLEVLRFQVPQSLYILIYMDMCLL
jgi:hypothetical protein